MTSKKEYVVLQSGKNLEWFLRGSLYTYFPTYLGLKFPAYIKINLGVVTGRTWALEVPFIFIYNLFTKTLIYKVVHVTKFSQACNVLTLIPSLVCPSHHQYS